MSATPLSYRLVLMLLLVLLCVSSVHSVAIYSVKLAAVPCDSAVNVEPTTLWALHGDAQALRAYLALPDPTAPFQMQLESALVSDYCLVRGHRIDATPLPEMTYCPSSMVSAPWYYYKGALRAEPQQSSRICFSMYRPETDSPGFALCNASDPFQNVTLRLRGSNTTAISVIELTNSSGMCMVGELVFRESGMDSFFFGGVICVGFCVLTLLTYLVGGTSYHTDPANILMARSFCNMCFAFSFLFPSQVNESIGCHLIGAWRQFFLIASSSWWALLSISVFLAVRYPFRVQPAIPWWFHAIGWGVSTIFTTSLVFSGRIGLSQMGFCWIQKHIGRVINLYVWLMFYIPLFVFLVMSVLVIIYVSVQNFRRNSPRGPSDIRQLTINLTLFYVIVFASFWALGAIVWFLRYQDESELRFDATHGTITNLFVAVIALLGVTDLICWSVTHRIIRRSRVSMRAAPPDMSLRQRLYHFSKTGVVLYREQEEAMNFKFVLRRQVVSTLLRGISLASLDADWFVNQSCDKPIVEDALVACSQVEFHKGEDSVSFDNPSRPEVYSFRPRAAHVLPPSALYRHIVKHSVCLSKSDEGVASASSDAKTDKVVVVSEAPLAFALLRARSGVTPISFREAFSHFEDVMELSDAADGSFNYLCNDFILRTVSLRQVVLLRDMLERYVERLYTHPNTLLTRIYGLHYIQPYPGASTIYFIVENAINAASPLLQPQISSGFERCDIQRPHEIFPFFLHHIEPVPLRSGEIVGLPPKDDLSLRVMYSCEFTGARVDRSRQEVQDKQKLSKTLSAFWPVINAFRRFGRVLTGKKQNAGASHFDDGHEMTTFSASAGSSHGSLTDGGASSPGRVRSGSRNRSQTLQLRSTAYDVDESNLGRKDRGELFLDRDLDGWGCPVSQDDARLLQAQLQDDLAFLRELRLWKYNVTVAVFRDLSPDRMGASLLRALHLVAPQVYTKMPPNGKFTSIEPQPQTLREVPLSEVSTTSTQWPPVHLYNHFKRHFGGILREMDDDRDRDCIYFIKVGDFLHRDNFSRSLQMWFQTLLLRQNLSDIAALPPDAYAERLQNVVSRKFMAQEEP